MNDIMEKEINPVNWLKMIKTNDLSVSKLTDLSCKITAKPLERGFGLTIGNSIRRVLLSSIRGMAVTRIFIEGVDHEFSSISGVFEDVSDIILNIKKLAIRSKDFDSVTLVINTEKKQKVYASDIQCPKGVEIVNDDLYICDVTTDKKLRIEMEVDAGYGYRVADQNITNDMKHGMIAIDSLFSPVENVSYNVEKTRIGDVTDYDSLVLDIKTNGVVDPVSAMRIAVSILQYQFSFFSGVQSDVVKNSRISEQKDVKQEPREYSEVQDSSSDIIAKLVKKIDFLDLSARSHNCLKNHNITYIGDLVQKADYEVKSFNNLGGKSFIEIEEKIKAADLHFGMVVPGWPEKYFKKMEIEDNKEIKENKQEEEDQK